MKKTIIILGLLAATIGGLQAQTKDSVDVSRFVAIYEYSQNTRMGKSGENVTDTCRTAVQVGSHCTRSVEYNWYCYWILGKRNGETLAGMLQHNINNVPMVYVGWPEGKITHREGVVPKAYETIEPTGSIEWQLCQESDSVAGYEVKKAIGQYGGRTWTAWYAEEIPTTAGPWKLHGLPGLILRAEEGEGVHRFVISEIRNEAVPIRFEPKPDHVKVARDKFIKFRNDLYLNPRYVKNPVYWLNPGENINIYAYKSDEYGGYEVEYYNGIYSPNEDNVRYYQPLELK